MTINQKITKTLIGVFFAAAFVFTSCNKGVVYSKYETFEEYEWYAKNKVTFDTDITDSLGLHDISLLIRHADAYPYSNLFVYLTKQQCRQNRGKHRCGKADCRRRRQRQDKQRGDES